MNEPTQDEIKDGLIRLTRLSEREYFRKEVLAKIDARIKNIQESSGEHGEEELSESLALVNELTSLRAEVVKVE